MSRSTRQGTDGENAVVKALLPRFPQAERRARRGIRDAGDISGLPGVVVEVKNAPRSYAWGEWLKEAEREMANAQASIGVVWAKQKGKGNAEDWIVAMRGSVFLQLLEAWLARPQ